MKVSWHLRDDGRRVSFSVIDSLHPSILAGVLRSCPGVTDVRRQFPFDPNRVRFKYHGIPFAVRDDDYMDMVAPYDEQLFLRSYEDLEPLYAHFENAGNLRLKSWTHGLTEFGIGIIVLGTLFYLYFRFLA